MTLCKLCGQETYSEQRRICRQCLYKMRKEGSGTRKWH